MLGSLLITAEVELNLYLYKNSVSLQEGDTTY